MALETQITALLENFFKREKMRKTVTRAGGEGLLVTAVDIQHIGFQGQELIAVEKLSTDESDLSSQDEKDTSHLGLYMGRMKP